jgi:O-antigen/teichoic acid export membrane protein
VGNSRKVTSLKQQALKGVKWTTISAVACSIIQVLRMSVLARLIPKEDFGLFATTAVVLGFANFFVEAGLGSAIIHKQDSTKEDLASAYSINIFLGWLIFASLYFLSAPIADFYQESRLISLLHVATIVFLIQPLGRQYDALFRREMAFNFLAKLDIFSALAGLVSSIVFAMNGFGVRALIFSQLITTGCRTLILLKYGIRQFGFNIGFKWQRAKFFLRFSAFQICENSVNYFNTQLDTIVIGKLLGQETLGGFFMVKQLAFKPIQIINPIITKISLPVFAKIQNDLAHLKRGYLKVVHTLSIVHFPLYICIAGFAREIITILFGTKWVSLTYLLQILCFYTMLRALGNPIGSLLMAKGRVDLGFYWNFALIFYTPTIMYFSSRWGITGISWGLLVGMLILNVPMWYFLVFKLCQAKFGEYFLPLIKNFAFASLCFGSLFFFSSLTPRILICLLGSAIYTWKHWNTINEIRGK